MTARLKQIVALLCCVGLLLAASALSPAVNEGRRSLNMYGSSEVTRTAPPEYAFLIQAFGSFRGLITNIVFIRAEEAKREGRYYDAMQLASWICKLQPRFPSVWEFQSWNMAWNISVTTYTPEERWNWVYNGAKLIRDEGLFYNPRAVNLYRQLAWIFVNKMSETTDEYHMTYKREWAYRMHLLLGPPPDPLGEYRPGEKFETLKQRIGDDPLARMAREEGARQRAEASEIDGVRYAAPELPDAEQRPLEYEVARKAAYDWLLEIDAAPQSLDQLYLQTPETRELVERLRRNGVAIGDERLNEDEYWREGGLAFTFFRPYRRLSDPQTLLSEVRAQGDARAGADAPERLRAFDEILQVKQQPAATAALVRFLQRKVLTQAYKLEPRKMAELVAYFGPMDWRVVDSHSLYWINEGLVAGGETISKFGNDKVNAMRLVFFSLHNLYRRNRLVFEPDYDDINRSYINFNMDLNFIESMHQAYLNYGAQIDPRPEAAGAGETFRAGHQNLLTEAIATLFYADRKREAQRYFQYLRDNYSVSTQGQFNPVFAKPLDQFVREYMFENIGGNVDRRNLITGSLRLAFRELANGNLAQYNQFVNAAYDLWSDYNKDKMTPGTDKLQLPPFPEYQADVLRDVLRDAAFTPGAVLDKVRLWRVVPQYLQQNVYDDVATQLARECALVKFELAAAFPEPRNMDAYRREHQRRAPPHKQDTKVETPAQQPK